MKRFCTQLENTKVTEEDIKKYLDNPPKPNYWKGLKMKFRRWWYNKK